MTITNPSPTRAPFDQERVRSKAVLSIDWTRGVATAITGQGATVTRAGNAFVTAGNGVLTPIGTNRPRLLHFVGANGGLLTEGERTNLLQRSEEFDDAYWSKSGAGTGLAPVVTANAAISPRGDMTADLVAFDRGAGNASGDFSRLIRTTSAAVVNGSTYTGGVFIKAATSADVGRTIGFRHVGAGTYGVITLTAEWQRINRTEAATSTTLEFEISSRGTVTASNQVSVHLWGAQVELGPFASTYTPTVAATVTRPTDQVSYADFPQPAEIAARGGITVYHRFVELGGGNKVFFQVGNGVQRRLIFYRDGASIFGAIQQTSPSVFLFSGVSVPFSQPATVEGLLQIEYVGGTSLRIRLGTSIDGGPIAFGSFSASTSISDLFSSGWGTSPTLFIGQSDDVTAFSLSLNQALKARFGIHDLASMRTLV